MMTGGYFNTSVASCSPVFWNPLSGSWYLSVFPGSAVASWKGTEAVAFFTSALVAVVLWGKAKLV